jgi:hypothetical protein
LKHDGPLQLEYRTAATSREAGNPRLVRMLAAATSTALLVLVTYFFLCSRETLGGLWDWVAPITAALGGSCYTALIAIDIAGRRRPKRTNWLQMAAGMLFPGVLLLQALEMVSDVRHDPYARTRDYVAWYTAAVFLIAFAGWLLWAAFLQSSHNRERFFRSPLEDQ